MKSENQIVPAVDLTSHLSLLIFFGLIIVFFLKKLDIMEDKNTKINQPTQDAMKGYDPTDRDFQRTEEETDNIDKSELEADKERTKKANTEPNKSNIN